MLTVFLFARLWRRAEVMTDVEFVELRYSGRPAAFLRGFRAVYLGFGINLIIMGWVNLGMAKILSGTLGIGKWDALIFCLAITFLYSILSGLWGVVVTDAVQFVIAMGGSIALAWFGVRAVGGLDALETALAGAHPAGNPEPFGPAVVNIFPDGSAIWMLPLLTLSVYLGVNWWASWYPGAEPGGGGYVAQRIFSSRTERDGLLATLWFNIAHYAVRPWPWILVALASTILYPGLENPREGYIRAVIDLLPPGLTGLVMAGFAAAYMSTISTQLNWGASYLVNDLYARFWRRGASQRELVRVGRVATGLIMVASLVVTYFLTSIEGAWRFLLALGAGTGLVLILRWYWWRINAWSEISAMIASLVLSLVLWFGVGMDPGDPAQWAVIMLATVAGSTVTWVAVTYVTRPEPPEVLRAFYLRVRPGGRGWSRVSGELGLGGEPIDGGPLNWTNWVAGVVSVYATLFGVGRWIFGDRGVAALFLGVAVVCFIWIGRNLRPSRTSIPPTRTPVPGHGIQSRS